MPAGELNDEIAAGVRFWGYDAGGALAGVMGVQPVDDVDLIRHAYVLPGRQRGGIGGALIEHLLPLRRGRMLVGTWTAADWALRFYARHGFEVVAPHETAALLTRYWRIPERQIETSVVLANPPFGRQA
jgi:GNAT superfamily N-acetyltransferase